MDEPKEFWIHQVIPENGREMFLAASEERVEQDAWIGWQSLFIEKSAYDRAKEISRNLEHSVARLEKHIKILRAALKALPRLNQKRGYPTGPEWQFLLDICDQALSDAEEVE